MTDELENAIEIIVPMVDNKMAIILLGCGAVVGAFFLYLYLNYQKNRPIPTLGVSATEPGEAFGEPPYPSLRGQSGTQPGVIDYILDPA